MKSKKETSKKSITMPVQKKKTKTTACTVTGCSCIDYVQPNTGTRCGNEDCGHYAGKHSG
jgi:hypothetical protein